MHRSMNRYRVISNAAKAGVWFVFCNILQRGIQFIMTPLYTRLLTTEEYGTYSIFMTWLNIFTIIATLNFSSGVYYNGLLKYEKYADKYTSAIQFLGNGLTLGFVTIMYIIYPYIEKYIGLSFGYILLMAIIMFFQPAYLFWSNQQRLFYKYRLLVGVTILNATLAQVIGVILVVMCDMQGSGIILGYIISNTIIGFIFYFRNFYRGKCLYNKKYWKYCLSLSLPLVPHYLSQIILGQSDRIMIKYYCGSSQAGIYSLAYQVSLIMSMVISGINNSLNPWMYRNIKEKKYRSIKLRTTQLIVMIAVLSGIAMLVAPEIVRILGTEDFLSAIWIIPPVMISTCIIFVYCIWSTVLFYFGRTTSIAVGTGLGAVLNLIFNAIFIPQFGVIAAAYTTLVGYIVTAIFYYYFTKKECFKEGFFFGDVFNMKYTILVFIFLGVFSVFLLVLYNFNSYIRYLILLLIIIIVFIKRKTVVLYIKNII